MPVSILTGDIFTVSARVLVNPVNTAGVMGAGLARQFAQRFPDMAARYRRLCADGRFQIGNLWLYHAIPADILCFPTKRRWRDPSRLDDIEAGLAKFRAIYTRADFDPIAFPALGCGLGGLDWERQVRPLMQQYLADLPITVWIVLPSA